uniref:Uncharacterized protein n=1 Tax=Myoviridae sp. ctnhb8 TaxID=2825171 RepID=A0A8S5VDZ8_9CAUD|nr:MAG TPA: hypothetical protein [Myoviridae sp. ctnhb8]
MVTHQTCNFLHITACSKRIGTALPRPWRGGRGFP